MNDMTNAEILRAADDAKAHNNEVLRKIDEQRLVREYAESLGCTEQQAKVFTRACAQHFSFNGARLMFKGDDGGLTWALDPTVRQYFQNNYAFLLPPPKPVTEEFEGRAVTIDPAVIASALGGSLSAKAAVARAFGADHTSSAASRKAVEEAELFLKAEGVKRTKGGSGDLVESLLSAAAGLNNGHHNHVNNPFSRVGWSLSKQGSVFKALGEAKTAALAASVGARIGSTHWNPDHPANK